MKRLPKKLAKEIAEKYGCESCMIVAHGANGISQTVDYGMDIDVPVTRKNVPLLKPEALPLQLGDKVSVPSFGNGQIIGFEKGRRGSQLAVIQLNAGYVGRFPLKGLQRIEP